MRSSNESDLRPARRAHVHGARARIARRGELVVDSARCVLARTHTQPHTRTVREGSADCRLPLAAERVYPPGVEAGPRGEGHALPRPRTGRTERTDSSPARRVQARGKRGDIPSTFSLAPLTQQTFSLVFH